MLSLSATKGKTDPLLTVGQNCWSYILEACLLYLLQLNIAFMIEN